MKRDYPISIAMASYNGEKYIKQQLTSILCQLEQNDEIVISDDGSTDKTVNIVKSFADSRIKLIDGPKNGVKQNFANAIKNCTGKYIFLSDQDDVWCAKKVEKVLECFDATNCACVVHNADIVDANLKSMDLNFFDFRKSGSGVIKNIIKNSYIGCCMAFNSGIRDVILPIPNDIVMHDQWIGILSEKHGGSIFLDECLIKYRRHESNVTQLHHNSLFKMLTDRLAFIKNYIKRKG